MSKASKKAKTVTPVLIALDASGSMYGLKEDVIGGFNQYIDDLKKDTENAYRVTLYIFNTTVEMLFNAIDVAKVPPLTEDTYSPRGGTALHDAIGNMVSARRLNDDEVKPLVVIHTDGKENASSEWDRLKVRGLIEERKAEGWGFVFLGAGPENWQQGIGFGMHSTMTVNSSAGTRGVYEGLVTGTSQYASGLVDADGASLVIGKMSQRRDREAREAGNAEEVIKRGQ